jgi:calcineurin-like phosphoesterase
MIRVLYIAEIVGKAGISCCKKALNLAKERLTRILLLPARTALQMATGLDVIMRRIFISLA